VQAISKHNPNDKVTVTYIRDGKTKTLAASLGKNDIQKERIFRFNREDYMKMEMFPFGGNGNGNFKVFHKNLKTKMVLKVQDVEEGNGVKVLEVDENSPADKAGLLKGDIITDINGEAIKTLDDLKKKTKICESRRNVQNKIFKKWNNPNCRN
jgi:serine protease Do